MNDKVKISKIIFVKNDCLINLIFKALVAVKITEFIFQNTFLVNFFISKNKF